MRIQIIETREDHRIKFVQAEREDFLAAKDSLKSIIGAGFRRWNAEYKEWRVLRSAREWLQEWLDSLPEGFVIDWQKDDAEFVPPRRDQLSAAYNTLYLVPGCPLELIKTTYKALARIYHPDLGGDVERMKQINIAYDYLTRRECET